MLRTFLGGKTPASLKIIINTRGKLDFDESIFTKELTGLDILPARKKLDVPTKDPKSRTTLMYHYRNKITREKPPFYEENAETPCKETDPEEQLVDNP